MTQGLNFMVDWQMIDWQTISNIAASLGFVLAIGLFIWEVRSNRKERALSMFVRLVDYYSNLMAERRHKWKLIKEKIRSDPRTEKEIGDKTSSLDYLLLRMQQKQSLKAIEHGLLEDEIRSLNLLNELCRYALKDKQMALILKVSYSSEISYYQKRLKDLLRIRQRERQLRLFSVPHYSHLLKLHISDYFEDLQHND